MVSFRSHSPKTQAQSVVRTMNPVNVYQISLHRSIMSRSSPAKRGGIGTYAGQGHVWRLGDIDAEYTDQIGDRFPKSLP
jgi:hypothetical protein